MLVQCPHQDTRTIEAAAWARRLQRAHALDAASAHMPLQRAIAALCGTLYNRQPRTIIKIAVLAAVAQRLGPWEGGLTTPQKVAAESR